MTVVDLHPEELLDKLLAGALSDTEQERLSAHLESCPSCRFECAARADFGREMHTLEPILAPSSLPLRMPTISHMPLLRRRRMRTAIWSVAAAALIVASGALASRLTGKAWWRAPPKFSPEANSVALAQAPPKRMQDQACGTENCAHRVIPIEPGAPSAASASELAPRLAATRDKSRPRPARSEQAAVPALELVPSPPESPEPASAAQLFLDANLARRSGEHERASSLYRVLQSQYPGSEEAELSYVTLASLRLDSGDAQAALTGFERYLAGSSRSLEPEALVGRARCLGQLGRRELEVSAWQAVQHKYPRSIYGRQASERLLELGQP